MRHRGLIGTSCKWNARIMSSVPMAIECGLHWKIFLISLYAFSVALCGASLMRSPINKAVIVGQRMEMECQSDNGSIFRKWEFVQIGNESPQVIATNVNNNMEIPSTVSGYGVDVDREGTVVLYSNSTETRNAGVYICQGETLSGSTTEFKYSAQLIVFESEPRCETNLTANIALSVGDYIWMECRVNFRGNWAPSMEWRQHDIYGDIDEGFLVSSETVSQNSSITSTVIVLVNSTNNDSYFSCRTYFTWHNGRLRTNANNIPNFNYSWNSYYEPTTMAIRISTTSPTAHGINSTTSGVFDPVLVFMLFGGLSVALILIMVITVAVCCAIIRRRTAELMAKVVATYENRDRPQSLRNSKRFSMLTLRRQMKATSLDQVERPEQEPSEGYTSVDDLTEGGRQELEPYQGYTSVNDITEECNRAVGGRPAAATPKYGVVFKKNQPARVAVNNDQYSLAKEDALDYATLRKNIEPPKWDSIHNSAGSDSDIEDLK